MRVYEISNQIFQGKVIGCSCLKPNQRKVFSQIRPCLEKLVKNEDCDLRIYLSYGNELRVSAGKVPEYAIINSNNPEIWITRSREIINDYKNKKREIT